jgi:hypothetical protein
MLHSKGLEGNQGDVDYINRTLFDFFNKTLTFQKRAYHSRNDL